MKIEVAKSDLEVALSVASIAAAAGGTDLTSHYLFRIQEGKAEVLSCDGRIFARSPLVATVDGEDGQAFTVEAWRMDKWVAAVPDGVVSLSSDASGDVHAQAGRSKTRLRSLDPSKFPFWDNILKLAKNVGSISPKSLAHALGLSKGFVSAEDTAKPELCQVEAIKGVLWATDRRALSAVEVTALPELSIRIPGKEVPAVVRFLNDKHTQENDVTIKEAERAFEDGGGAFALFERADGSYVGVNRPTSKFPTLNVDKDAVGDAQLDLDRAEFESAVSVLLAGAPKGHESITFSYDEKTSTVSISMPCEAGGTDIYPLTLAKVTDKNGKFDTAFTVDYPYIKGISTVFGLDQLSFTIKRHGRGGYIAFRHEDDGASPNKYTSVLVWRT
jgi:hypothetical protein